MDVNKKNRVLFLLRIQTVIFWLVAIPMVLPLALQSPSLLGILCWSRSLLCPLQPHQLLLQVTAPSLVSGLLKKPGKGSVPDSRRSD